MLMGVVMLKGVVMLMGVVINSVLLQFMQHNTFVRHVKLFMRFINFQYTFL